MIDRRGICEQVISKLKAIQQFQSEQKAADPNWKMRWLQEKTAPEGFKERKRKWNAWLKINCLNIQLFSVYTIQILLWLLLEIILIHNTNSMKEKIFMDTFKLSTFLGPNSALNQLDQCWNLQAISDFSWVGFSISSHGYQLFQPKTTRVTGTKNGWQIMIKICDKLELSSPKLSK